VVFAHRFSAAVTVVLFARLVAKLAWFGPQLPRFARSQCLELRRFLMDQR
jgi:hypothetical protein